MLFNPPIHPGEILREEFLAPTGMKPYTLAVRLGIQRSRIERVVAGTNPITPDTALRLGRLFNTTPQFWLNMQATYDLAVAEKEIAEELEHIVPEPTVPVPEAEPTTRQRLVVTRKPRRTLLIPGSRTKRRMPG